MTAAGNRSRRVPALVSIALAALAAQVLPGCLVLLQMGVGSRFIGTTYGAPYTLFELFGCSGFLFVAFAVWIGFRSLPSTPASQLRLLAFAVVACSTLLVVTECTQQSYDYLCYQRAAQAYLNGTPAYGNGYIYPPLVATALGLLYRFLASWLRMPEPTLWYLVFYAWQTLQFFLYLAAFELTLQVVRRRVPAAQSTRNAAILLLVTTVLFVVDNALLRTLRFNQVNLLVLDATLLAVLLLDRAPVLAALALALGIHVKLYPALLVLPLALMRRLRDVALLLVMGGALYVLQVYVFHNGSLWTEFFSYVPHANTGTFIRDTSVHSIVLNTVALLGGGPEALADARTVTLVVWYLAFGAYFLRRQLRLLGGEKKKGAQQSGAPLSLRMTLDTLPFLVLVSPMVWEHHWVLMIPFAVACLNSRLLAYPRAAHTATAAVCIALIFWVPTFDLYPLSYCRLAGLFGLLAITDRKGI